MTPEEQKKLRDRANRARRALLKEKETYGWIDDSSGKRYRAPVDYVLAGENQKALEFFAWFESEFPDDIGDPIFDLYWALAEFRAGHAQEASRRLKSAMLGNLYILPFILGEPIHLLDIWHSSNLEYPDYAHENEVYLREPTPEEREWIGREYNSQDFAALRAAYIHTYHQLKDERNIEKRREILDEWRRYSSQHLE